MRKLMVIAVAVLGCGRDPAPAGGAGDTGGLDVGIQDTVSEDVGVEDVMDVGEPDDGIEDVGGPDVPDVPDIADAGPDIADAGPDVPDVKDTKDAGDQGQGVEDTGPISGFTWVRIDDDPDNASLQVCLDVYASPGADIDSVSLYREGELMGHGEVVIADLNKDPHDKGMPCLNNYDHEDEALGPPDAGAETGLVSLNGGTLLIRFEGAPEILEGDIISVVEAGAGAVGVPEWWFLSIGVEGKLSSEWVAIGGKQESSQDVVVDF